MRDQQVIWEEIYREELTGEPPGPSDFAKRVASLLGVPARVLELGCGTGADAAYFASLGHDVLALDFAPEAVRFARDYYGPLDRLRFEVQDISRTPLLLPSDGVDLIYARLSLHYFTDAFTRSIFTELRRLLAPQGLLAFMCKSTSDPRYGEGTEIEPDMFESDHARHFFSLDYAAGCLRSGFEVVSLTEDKGPLYGSSSAFVTAIARKTA
jgi:SAM-dependent methyltransferase